MLMKKPIIPIIVLIILSGCSVFQNFDPEKHTCAEWKACVGRASCSTGMFSFCDIDDPINKTGWKCEGYWDEFHNFTEMLDAGVSMVECVNWKNKEVTQ